MIVKTYLVALALAFAASAIAAGTTQPLLFVVHFEKGASWDDSLAATEQATFREHSANLKRLRSEGAIVFGARYEQFGMIFLRAASLAEAKTMLDADPGVKSGLFSYRVAPMSVFYPYAGE